MDIGETGKVSNAATPSEQQEEKEKEEEEGGKPRVEEEKPQDNAPQENQKNPISPLPASYAAEYIDPHTGQMVRKLVITSAEKSPFHPKNHQKNPPQEQSSSSNEDKPTPMQIDTAVKRRRSTEEETTIKRDGQGKTITRTETDAERASKTADRLLAEREAEKGWKKE